MKDGEKNRGSIVGVKVTRDDELTRYAGTSFEQLNVKLVPGVYGARCAQKLLEIAEDPQDFHGRHFKFPYLLAEVWNSVIGRETFSIPLYGFPYLCMEFQDLLFHTNCMDFQTPWKTSRYAI